MTFAIVHNLAARRFETTVEGYTAVLEYEERGKALAFTHTYVPVELRGRGVAAELTAAALAHARSRGVRVVPECSYVAAYLKKHREHADLVAGESGG